MLEFFVSFLIFLILFGAYFISFYLEKIFKLIALTLEIYICFFLFLNDVAYKKNDLWKNPQIYRELHFTDFMPLKDIKTNPESIDATNFFILKRTTGFYSIIKKGDYKKECLDNYFIESNSECPITDIILESEQTDKYEGYIELNVTDNFYIYYTRDKKNAKLYKDISIIEVSCYEEGHYEINGICYFISFISDFNYKHIEKIKEQEEEKNKNPFLKLKNFAKYSDFICFILLIFALVFTLNEPFINRRMNYYKISGYIFILISTILFIIRYAKFVQIKKYYNDNEEEYKDKIDINDENYFFPKKVFNLDGILPSMSIVIIIAIILYIILPNDKHIFCKDIENLPKFKYPLQGDEGGPDKRNNRVCFILFPINIIFFIVFILDILNDNKIKEKYDIFKYDLTYNWATNPIKSIDISNSKTYQLGQIIGSDYSENRYYTWKDNYFDIRKMQFENYFNIYDSKNGKVCGKDNQNNNLYFPQSTECPINDIFISTENKEVENYIKIELEENGGFLYYTNKNTEGKIIIDLQVGCSDGFQLRLNESNTLCHYLEKHKGINSMNYKIDILGKCENSTKYNTIPFYKSIDKGNLCEFVSCYDSNEVNVATVNLYAIYYQGVNSLKVTDMEIIGIFDKKFDKYKGVLTAKYVFDAFTLLSIVYFNIIIFKGNFGDYMKIWAIIAVAFLVLLFVHIILCAVALGYNITYIKNFLNVINADFESCYMNESLWIILLLIIDIYLFTYFIIVFIFSFLCKKSLNANVEGIIPQVIPVLRRIDDSKKNEPENTPHQDSETLKGVKPTPINNNNDNQIKFKIEDYDESKNEEEEDKKKNEKKENKENKEDKKGGEVNPKNQEKKECVICMENEPEVVFGPCGHKCICEQCYEQNNTPGKPFKSCPICRKTIDTVIRKVYEV